MFLGCYPMPDIIFISFMKYIHKYVIFAFELPLTS